MRLLLDAHLSGRVIGRHLREQGHDVLALDEHKNLEGLDDPDVLELAAKESRILLTHNVKDFPDILRDWADEAREHAGCIVLVGIQLSQFGHLIRSIEAALASGSDQQAWLNRSVLIGRQDTG
jgi:predicted nuclease of predicted toxin-antitoxin system